jgi:signal transduction histidine kinase
MSPDINIAGNDTTISNSLINYSILPIKNIQNPKFVLSDTMLYDNITESYQPYRILRYETILKNSPVRILVSRSLVFSYSLIEYVVLGTLLLSLILLACFVFLNNFLFSRIWGSFFNTINIIKDYNIKTDEIHFSESEITEFNMLNNVFETMHRRIRMDYKNLKEFIENISHEIQNPLAIINSRIELLQQNSNIDSIQAELIRSIQGSAIRLSNLSKSLILLSKIDNNQFPEREVVDVESLVNLHVENFQDMIRSKNISLNKNFNNPVRILADPNLISILLLNLLKNSVFHNIPSGFIEIMAEDKTLTITNSGKKLDIDKEDLFKRFTKSSTRSDSLGLGLSIVKKICDYYQYKIQYTYQNDLHMVSITFN